MTVLHPRCGSFEVSGTSDLLTASQGARLEQATATDVDEERWRLVLGRQASSQFVYAVQTTGVFCRTTCPSRRPTRTNVLFFPDAATARAAGFRACLRCQPGAQPDEAIAAARITGYLEEHLDRQVPLAELARLTGYAAPTVQRMFARVMGVSPRAWANARRAESYRDLLAEGRERVTDAVYASGFSSASRAHAAATLGMEARRYKAQGAGEQIGYVIADALLSNAAGRSQTALGRILVAATTRGLCAVLLGDEDAALVTELASRFSRATLAADASLAPWLAAVLASLNEHPSAETLPLDLRGTAFQVRVWEALRQIPPGQTRSYARLALELGVPKAVRAVAAACGQNPAALVVPCHRVLGSNGKLTGYRWGLGRKQALLAREQTRPSGRQPSAASTLFNQAAEGPSEP